jgi:hypothetical protein
MMMINWNMKRAKIHYMHVFKDTLVKPIKHCMKRGKREGEWDYK